MLDWPGLSSFLHRTRSERLDLRRLVHANAKAPEETWRSVAPALARLPATVSRLELPKISPGDLVSLVPSRGGDQPLRELVASSLAAGKEEVPLEALASAPALKSSVAHLKLRSLAGKMRLSGGGLTPLGDLAKTLTKLVRIIATSTIYGPAQHFAQPCQSKTCQSKKVSVSSQKKIDCNKRDPKSGPDLSHSLSSFSPWPNKTSERLFCVQLFPPPPVRGRSPFRDGKKRRGASFPSKGLMCAAGYMESHKGISLTFER